MKMHNTNIMDDPRFKIFHDLMSVKVRNILLISRQYDAWMMEEDCRLSEKIVTEYRGLNLSNPPRLHWVSSKEQALALLNKLQFEIVIIIAGSAELHPAKIAAAIKSGGHDVPVTVMLHQDSVQRHYTDSEEDAFAIHRTFLWTGNTEVLLALIKSTEDWLNVDQDTNKAGIRSILFVEDSPEYTSAVLPILYKELVIQAQEVMDEGLNEEHRLLAMRARPKILVVNNYESALSAYEKYKNCILGVISDVRFPRDGKLDSKAGFRLLEKIKSERFDIQLLLISSESSNKVYAKQIPARFVDKNSPTLPSDIREYFKKDLGFGDFIFKTPQGRAIGKAKYLWEFEKMLSEISEESFLFHGRRNDFSRWLFVRSEIELAARIRPLKNGNYSDTRTHCKHLAEIIHQRRIQRQRGLVIDFNPQNLDLDTEFFKVGNGSLGGKARGLAFFNTLLYQHIGLHEKYPDLKIRIPKTLVITTEAFEQFVETNALQHLAGHIGSDEEIVRQFKKAVLPSWLIDTLEAYLTNFGYPLAVRSSSLLEDAQYRAYAGMFNTYMLPNDHDDLECRLEQLVNAVKMVYASTFFSEPKTFSRRVGHRIEEEKMAVIIQELAGDKFTDYFYPGISGVAQSYNFYPYAKMRPEDGICTIALGLGKSVMGGENALRFSPKNSTILPDRSRINDILKHSQRHFYALKMGIDTCGLGVDDSATLVRREIYDAVDEHPVQSTSSTFCIEENRIRDTFNRSGNPIITFNSVLKHKTLPLADLITDTLKLGSEGMGTDVEMEFCANFATKKQPAEFVVLQLRPMGAREESRRVKIDPEEIQKAFTYSRQALGNTVNRQIRDILIIKPQTFKPSKTKETAVEIGKLNSKLMRENRKYLLIGPGRWGSADPWLGIPVRWDDICGVEAIVETEHPEMNAEPSQGSHFFHNITTLGINYLTISKASGGHIDHQWLAEQGYISETENVAMVRLRTPIVLKVDGKQGIAVIYAES